MSIRPSAKRTLGVVVALASIATISFAYITLPTTTETELTPASDTEVVSTLARLGLVPDTLAAAGVTPAETTLMIDTLRLALSVDIAALRSNDALFRSSKPVVDRLSRGRNRTAAQDAELARATSDLGNAEAARASILDRVFTSATAVVSRDKIDLIEAIRDGRAEWDLPIEYLAAGKTESELLMLRNALANDRITAKRGQPVAAHCAAVIAEADADETTSACRLSIAASLDDVEAAWKRAAGL